MPKKGIVNIIGGLKSAFAKIGGYFIWFLIIILCVSVVRNVAKVGAIKSEVARDQAKVDKIKAENSKLEDEIARTQADSFVEKQIRDKLGLAKEGEAVVILPDPDVVKKFAPVLPQEENSLPDPNWRRWLKLFL